MIDKFAHFLSNNSWIVVVGAILTFYQVVKWLWLRQSDVSIWLAKESRYETEDVKLAAANASFYISQLIRNAENFSFFALMGSGFFWFSSLFEYDVIQIGNSSAKVLSYLAGIVLWGAAFVTLLRTSYFSRSVAEAAKRKKSDGTKK